MGHLFTEPIDQCSDFSVQSSGISEKSCTWMWVWRKGFIRKMSIGSICCIPLLNTHANIKVQMIKISLSFL